MAASTVSSGIPRSAADRMTMANPVWIQIRMNIRKKLFQNGKVIQVMRARSPPQPDVDCVQNTDLVGARGARLVNQFPDHRCAYERDCHGHKDQRLSRCCPMTDPVRHLGHQQAQRGGHGRRHNDQPQQCCCACASQNLGSAQTFARIIVKPSPGHKATAHIHDPSATGAAFRTPDRPDTASAPKNAGKHETATAGS